MIESVLSTFVRQYAERYPKVEVKFFEAFGPAQLDLLERGEVHVGIRMHTDDIHIGKYPLPPIEVVAAVHPRFSLGVAAWWRSPASRHIRCFCWNLATPTVGPSTQPAAWLGSSRTFCSRAARRTLCWRSPRPDAGWRSFRRSYELLDEYMRKIFPIARPSDPSQSRVSLMDWPDSAARQ